MTLIRRFFSGPSLTQAVLAAARHHEVDPEDLAYEVIDKKHGFLKTPRGVVIEVDPDRPTAAATGAAPETVEEAAAEATEAPTAAPGAARDRLEALTEPVSAAPVPTEPIAPDAESEPGEAAWNEPVAASSSPADPEAAEPVSEAPRERHAEQLMDVESAPEGGAPAPRVPESEAPESEAPEPEVPESEATESQPVRPRPAEPQLDESQPEEAESPLLEPANAAPASPEPTESWWRDDEPPTPFADAEPSDDPGAAQEPEDDAPAEAAPEAEPSSVRGAPLLDEDLRRSVAEAVDELVYLAGLRVQAASVVELEDGLAVDLEGPDSRRVVAHGGRSLLAIQHLLPRLLFSRLGRAVHCRLDCEGFHSARTERLERLARKAADRVREGGRSWLLEPMAPDERRLVHLALADEPDVETESVGEGYLKRVRVARS